jgi:hypothetical protein
MPQTINRNNFRSDLNHFQLKQSKKANRSTMKKFLLFGLLVCLSILPMLGQEKSQTRGSERINRDNLVLRPNSRDYTIIRKGNNHQRIIQLRTQTMIRNRQALLNRKMAMDHRRAIQRQKMIKQQQIKQRMIRQRGMHR